MPILIFRPNKDLTPIEHLYHGANQAFNTINESASDEDSSYIYTYVNKTESQATSNFNFHSPSPLPSNITITKANLIMAVKSTGDRNAQVYINGALHLNNQDTVGLEQKITGGSIYKNYTFDFLNHFQTNNNIVSDIPIKIMTHGIDTAKNGSSIVITQSYFEIEYTINSGNPQSFYIKENGKWEKYNTIYKKVNKKWIQIDANQIFNNTSNGEITQYVYGGKIK